MEKMATLKATLADLKKEKSELTAKIASTNEFIQRTKVLNKIKKVVAELLGEEEEVSNNEGGSKLLTPYDNDNKKVKKKSKVKDSVHTITVLS